MATFVLVHGLGLGGWCWSEVAQKLRHTGHQVFTPTLTGVGERSHLANAGVDLHTHISDVANVLRWERLSDVILVGHSYGGAVVTGAADQQANRIRRLVYLDAFVLEDGQSVISLQPPERVKHYEKMVAEHGDGWLVAPNSGEFYQLQDQQQRKWVDDLSTAQPYATLTQPISLQHKGPPVFARSYIWGSAFTPSPFQQFAQKLQGDSDWDYREIPAGHMMMLSHVDELTHVLEKLA